LKPLFGFAKMLETQATSQEKLNGNGASLKGSGAKSSNT
jgi:hypothetical protein